VFDQKLAELLDLAQVIYSAFVSPARCILDNTSFGKRYPIGQDILDRLDLELLVVVPSHLVVCGLH